MKTASAKRTLRRDPGGVRVTPRDLCALSFVAEAQPVTTSEVRRLLGLSEDMAHRRMGVLRDLGLVRVHVAALHEENRYTLAGAGVSLLARVTGRDPESFHVPRGIERLDLAHHEVGVDLYVAVRLGTGRSRAVRLVRWMFERGIRRAVGGVSGVLVPDALAEFEHTGGRRSAVAFEVDLGTENPAWLVAHKGRGYAAIRASGGLVLGCESWNVGCLVSAPERRMHRLALALAEAGLANGAWHFLHVDCLDDRTLLGPSWLSPIVDEKAGTVTLVPSSPWQTVGTGGRTSSDPPLDEKSCSINELRSSNRGTLASEDAR